MIKILNATKSKAIFAAIIKSIRFDMKIKICYPESSEHEKPNLNLLPGQTLGVGHVCEHVLLLQDMQEVNHGQEDPEVSLQVSILVIADKTEKAFKIAFLL